jgi:GT2 family glycosyltransferase
MVDKPAPFAVVVVNYGSSSLLEQNLAPLTRALAGQSFVVVVVDNPTDAAERSRVIELARLEGWFVELSDSNIGFGAGVNLGVARATVAEADTFVLVNPDATIPAADVVTLVRESRSSPLQLLAPLIVRPDGTPWFSGADLYLDEGRIRSSARREQFAGARLEPWLSGACLVVSDTLWRRVGGFAPDYFLYWEDVDLSHRVQAAGGSVRVCHEAIAVHAEGGTQGGEHQSAGGSKSPAYYYYGVRNRMLFAVANLGPREVRLWRQRMIPVAWETLLQGGRRELLRPTRVAAAIRGLRHGWAIARRGLSQGHPDH